jgi:hypothetical protein
VEKAAGCRDFPVLESGPLWGDSGRGEAPCLGGERRRSNPGIEQGVRVPAVMDRYPLSASHERPGRDQGETVSPRLGQRRHLDAIPTLCCKDFRTVTGLRDQNRRWPPFGQSVAELAYFVIFTGRPGSLGGQAAVTRPKRFGNWTSSKSTGGLSGLLRAATIKVDDGASQTSSIPYDRRKTGAWSC